MVNSNIIASSLEVGYVLQSPRVGDVVATNIGG